MGADRVSGSSGFRASFEEQWKLLIDMEEQVGRKGFDKGREIGKAEHEIRSLITYPVSSDTAFVAAGDKNGFVYAGCFDRNNGNPFTQSPWRKLDSPGFADGRRVVDALQIVQTGAGLRLVVGTRGNGAWLLPLDELIAGSSDVDWQALPGSGGEPVRRLMFDGVAKTLWAAAGTRCLAWSLKDQSPELRQDHELHARATAFTIDRGSDSNDDHLYVATNMSTIHRFLRGADGNFAVAADLTDKDAIWCGRSSVIENMIPLSAIVARDSDDGPWRRRFKERGLIATTLRHIMVLFDDDNGNVVCDVRRVAMYSKILAAAPICFPRWQGVAVTTLEKNIRLFRPSGIRRPKDDHASYLESAPENASPRSLLGGYEDIEFLKERVYAIDVLPSNGSDGRATVILGMGDHNVRHQRFEVSWEVRRRAQNRAERMIDPANVGPLLRELEAKALRPTVPGPEKYACSVLIPEIGKYCSNEQWQTLDFLVWDVLAGADAIKKVPVHLIQSLRRLQKFRPDKREAIEQTITRIRKHIFDRESFSGKSADFLNLTRSTDKELEDDRTVYQSILISRRHDPMFRQTFAAEEFGEVQSFESIPGVDEQPSGIPPSQRRFLVGTYRKALWIFDGNGQRKRIEGIDGNWGFVQAMLCMPEDVIFGFSRGQLRRASRDQLTQSFDIRETLEVEFRPVEEVPPSYAPLCFSRLPAPSARDKRFLWADVGGRIHLCPRRTDKPVFELEKDGGVAAEGRRINVIQALSTNLNGRERKLVVAGTDLGYLVLLEWTDGAKPELRRINAYQAGTAAVTSLLAHREGYKQIVAACADGNVTGWWVTTDVNGEPALHVYWAFGAGEAVQQLRRLTVNIGSSDGTTPCQDELIGISSHDQHLHIVDHVGRHLETIYIEDVKLDRFVAVADDPEGGFVEARIYATAFENEFLCFRLISRRNMLERLRQTMKKQGPAEREANLSRWRAYAIREGHLRHRFVRQSTRYPGRDAMAVIVEIRRLLRLRHSEEGPTGVMTALLRRLFQTRSESDLRTLPQKHVGLGEILEKPDVYRAAIEILLELEGQWDTPGSVPNRRVQYFWIRSLLREIRDIKMLRLWIEAGNKSDLELGKPDRILDHYLEHSSELVQFKVLQALERMLVGWPGTDEYGVLSAEDDRRAEDAEWVLAPMLARLRLSRGKIDSDQPNLVVLQIGKILCHLIRIGSLEPLYLTYQLQRYDVPSGMYTILLRQCAAMSRPDARAAERPEMDVLNADEKAAAVAAEGERLFDAATIIGAVQRLNEVLEISGPIPEVVSSVESLVGYCRAAHPNDSNESFAAAAAQFYEVVLKLLRVNKLQSLLAIEREVADAWERPNNAFKASFERLSKFVGVIGGLIEYRKQKEDDRFGNQFNALTFEALDIPRKAWRTLNEELRRSEETIPPLEIKLLVMIANAWNKLLDDTHEELLSDLVELVNEQITAPDPPPPSAREAAQRLAKAEEMTTRALKNLFIRLALYAEPLCAGLFHRNAGATGVVPHWLDLRTPQPAPVIQSYTGDWPSWLDTSLAATAKLSAQTPEQLENDLQARVPDVNWKVIAIPEIGDVEGSFGFLIFGWRAGSAGETRFKGAELLWNFLLQSLIFKKAALQQHALRGTVFSMVAHNLGAPVFHLCSDARVLVDRFPELEQHDDNRFAKYDQVLRQSRHMQGIIDAILSIDGREARLNLKRIPLASLVYEVVRTLRPEAKASNVTIEYQQPNEEMDEKTLFVTDEVRVYDIMLNLVSNAVKYSPENGIVKVSTSVTPRGALLSVSDTGPDVPEVERKLIFEPFFRGRSAGSLPGLGLGLYVADIYAKALKGRISVPHHAPGKTFVVFLPYWQQSGA